MNFCEVKASNQPTSIIKFSIAVQQCLKAILEKRGNGLRSKTHEPALVQAPARLRANVPSYRLRAASYVLRHGVVGSRGETPSLPFLCRRFFSQTEKKCRNAGSIYCLIIVGREGNSQL